MTTHICINIGSSEGLLPGDTKPLTEPMLSKAFHTGNAQDFLHISLKIINLRLQPPIPGVNE